MAVFDLLAKLLQVHFRVRTEKISRILKDTGWCYGSEDPDAAYAHYRWLPCELNYEVSADVSVDE